VGVLDASTSPPKERYAVSKDNIIKLIQLGNVDDQLTVRQAHERAVQRGDMELREKGKPVQRVPVGGVGFVFDGQPDTEGLVFAGVDFDKVISGGEIAPLAAERIRRLGSYTERSVSGGGLHVILKAWPLASGIAHDGVEMYTSGRFFTMTGDTL
jgi:hypothetical protein